MTLVVEYTVEASKAEARFDARQIVWRSPEANFSSTTGDFALLACLPKAMREGRDLHISGQVDRQTVRNAWLLSHFWSQWKPKLYSPVSISADEIADARQNQATGEYVICLSGGVDSTFAGLSAVASDRPEDKYNVTMGIFVHGFDYLLDNDVGYSKVLQSIRHSVRDFGIRAIPVETDWKEEICGWPQTNGKPAGWEDVHSIGLASVLHLFGGAFRGGMIGSDYTFREDHAVAPWSSNATANRMLGSGSFAVQPIGEHASRLEKIRAIHNWGKFPLINVCWAGPRTGFNCSRCEKCLRTMLMCEALGIDPIPAFGRSPSAQDISNMQLSSSGKIAFVQQALNTPGGALDRSLRRAARLAILKSRVRNHTRPWVAALPGLGNSRG